MDFLEKLWILHWCLNLIWDILGQYSNILSVIFSLSFLDFLLYLSWCAWWYPAGLRLIFLYCLRLDNLNWPIFNFTDSSVSLNLHRATLVNFSISIIVHFNSRIFVVLFFFLIISSLYRYSLFAYTFFLRLPFNSLEDPFSFISSLNILEIAYLLFLFSKSDIWAFSGTVPID